MKNKAKRQIFELIDSTVMELSNLVINLVKTDCRTYCFHMYNDVFIECVSNRELNT